MFATWCIYASLCFTVFCTRAVQRTQHYWHYLSLDTCSRVTMGVICAVWFHFAVVFLPCRATPCDSCRWQRSFQHPGRILAQLELWQDTSEIPQLRCHIWKTNFWTSKFEHRWNLGFFPETFPHETCFIILACLLRGSRAQCVFAALFPSFLQISQSNHSSSISGSSGGHGVCRKSTFSDKPFFNECSLAVLNQTWKYKLAGKTEKVPPIGSKHRRQSWTVTTVAHSLGSWVNLMWGCHKHIGNVHRWMWLLLDRCWFLRCQPLPLLWSSSRVSWR